MMKTKLGIAIVVLGFLVAVNYLTKDNRSGITSNYQKASFNFVKCTPTKFMLDVIDTTEQISPFRKSRRFTIYHQHG